MLGEGRSKQAPPLLDNPTGSEGHRPLPEPQKGCPWRSPRSRGGPRSWAAARREFAAAAPQEPRRLLLCRGRDTLKIDFSVGNGIMKPVVSISIIVITK